MLNHQNLYDINIHSETFFCGLLNVIFGYNLENFYDSEKIFTSLDLEDKLNRVAIQVTTQEASSKIQYTLDKFFENKLDKTFDRLIVLIIGTKLHYSILRPELVGSNIASVTSQPLYGLSTTPVTDVVYKWLDSELTAIGWLK